MNTDLVTIEVSNGIADVRLNRGEKYNALSHDMFDAIIAAGQSLANASDVSAVVLSGNGRGFCAGLDMANFAFMAAPPFLAVIAPFAMAVVRSTHELMKAKREVRTHSLTA